MITRFVGDLRPTTLEAGNVWKPHVRRTRPARPRFGFMRTYRAHRQSGFGVFGALRVALRNRFGSGR